MAEAENMYKKALELGVPEANIMKEALNIVRCVNNGVIPDFEI